MSKQNVLAFDKHIRGNKDLQSRVKSLPANDADGLVKLGAESGYSFSSGELLEVIGLSHNSDELSSEELDQVAGGALNSYFPPQSPIMSKFAPPSPSAPVPIPYPNVK